MRDSPLSKLDPGARSVVRLPGRTVSFLTDAWEPTTLAQAMLVKIVYDTGHVAFYRATDVSA